MGWIDLHCHPLPGIDDGARTAEDGAALLAGLYGLGFETVVATPHVRSGVWDNRVASRDAAHEVLSAMMAEARRRGDTLPTLLLAGEHMFDDVLQDLLRKGEALTYPGGGAALLYATRALDNVKTENFDQARGVDIVRKALQAPCRRIADNAGVEGAVVVGNLLAQDNQVWGYDAQNGVYTDMIKAGIIDPTKVVRTALVDAASVASLMATTDCMVTDLPKDDAPLGGGRGGMGGMGDMM